MPSQGEYLVTGSSNSRFAHLLLKKRELALLRLEARLHEVLKSLSARRVLLARNNAPLLRLHKVLACEATARVLGRTVIDLGLRAHRRHAATLLARAAYRARTRIRRRVS
jgi:hypothetical protein